MTSTEELASILLQHLQIASGDPNLTYKTPPRTISGGLSGSLIYCFELDSLEKRFSGEKILRVSVSHSNRERIKEVSLQTAANRLGNLAPTIRLHEKDDFFGGVFFVMDRLRGGTLWRWYWVPVGVSIVLSIMMSQLSMVILGYLAGVALVGVAMAKQKLALQTIPLPEVIDVCREYSLQDAEVGSEYWLKLIRRSIEDEDLTGYRDGLCWLEKNELQTSRPGLCLGDFHPANCMVTWNRVTGLIDWEMACIADPELDIGALRYLATLIGPLVLPVYWMFRIYLHRWQKYDERKVNYYEAQRILFMLSSVTRTRIEGGTRLTTEYPFPNQFRLWVMKLMVWSHCHRFQKLTGVKLTPPVSVR